MWTYCEFCSRRGCFSYPLHLWSSRKTSSCEWSNAHLSDIFTYLERRQLPVQTKLSLPFPYSGFWTFPLLILEKHLLLGSWHGSEIRPWLVDICLFHLLTVEKGLYLMICILGHLYVCLLVCFSTVVGSCPLYIRLSCHQKNLLTCMWHFRKVEQ